MIQYEFTNRNTYNIIFVKINLLKKKKYSCALL